MHESAERRSGQTTDHPDDAPRPTSPSPAPTARYESVLYDSPQFSRGRHRAPEDPETEAEEGAEDLNDPPSAAQASDRQADTPDDASHYATTPPSVHTANRLDQELGSRRFTWVREAFHEYVLRKDRIAPIVSALLLALVLWQLPDSLPRDARTTFAVFGVAVWFWVFSSIDDTYVALGGSSILVLTGVITVDEFFGPLGDTTTWLLIGAFIISTGVATSGLAMRGAVIVTAGTKNPRMLVHAVTLATVCTVFAVPATAGRAALLVPVFVALGRVLKAQHSWLVVTLSLLFPSVILLSAVGSLIGAGAHLITDQILQDNNLKSIGFASWLIAGLPLAIVTSHLAAEVILFATSSSRQRSEKLDLSLESLAEHAGGVHKIKGPLSQSESRSLLVLCLAVLLWSTESLHGIHPALVPGVSVEDRRVRYGVDRVILAVVGLLVVGFVVWGVLQPDAVLAVSSAALDWVMLHAGWLFALLAIGMVVFLLALAFSRYGEIPLGLDGEKPEYSTASWSAMLFAAGIGIGIIFFGPYEPLTYYLAPRPGAYEAGSEEAVTGALAQAALHWGVNAWAIYAIVGLSVGYVSYRRGRVPLMSSIIAPLFGDSQRSDSVGARLIDGLAIIATLFGTAASLGIGALQIGRGVEIVSGWSAPGNTVALGIIVVLTIGTIFSAVSGVARGIRWLSNINMLLALGLALFFFVVGPTAFLLNIVPGVLMDYVSSAPDALGASMAEGEDMQEFLSSWTIFYWAWWVSWAPFVGVFMAKISKGRTIRQYVLGALFIPAAVIVGAFTIIGGTTIWLQRTQGSVAPDGTAASLPAPAEIFWVVLDQLPGGGLVAPVVIVMLAVFFITTADSASIVNSQLSQRGAPAPRRTITVFWALCMAGIAVVMLLTGGDTALTGLQNLITITALPFTVVLVLMAVALQRELANDPFAIRDRYQRAAVEKATVRGLVEYGDDFAFTVERTPPGSWYAAGEGFDSTAAEITDWYRRTDEDGNPVEYDYVLGEYLDDGDGADGPAGAGPSAR